MNILDIINIPAGAFIRFCNKLVGNQYVLTLLIFAFVIEVLLLFAFGIKQQKNSIKQARLRPKELAIRKKYAGRDDNVTKQKMQAEIQEMYQKEGYNPMSGCLPLLIQFPIIIALYNIVMNPLKYICNFSTDAINGIMNVVKSYEAFADSNFSVDRNIDLMSAMKKIIETDGVEAFSQVEGFSDTITSAADIPNLTVFGGAIDLAATPSFTNFSWLLLIPVLTFVAYFVSMKVNRKLMYQPAQDAAMGCSNKIMDFAMPLMSVFITFGVPAALGVYWIFKCLLGMLKQFLLSLIMPIPKFTDEELKAAEKEYAAKAPKESERVTNSNGAKRRSLHYIDQDDYEDVTKKSDTRDEQPKEEAPSADDGEEKKNNLLGQAEMKEYDPLDRNRKKEKRSKKGTAEDNAESDEKDDK